MPGSGLPPGLTTGLLTVEEAAVSSSRSGAAPSCQEPGVPRGGGSLGPVYSAVQCSTGRLSRDQYSAVQCSTGGMTSALLASQICVTTVLSLAKQRVNCPHACKINNMKGMNTFYLLLNYYQLLTINTLFWYPFKRKLNQICTVLCIQHTEKQRYQDTISTIS